MERRADAAGRLAVVDLPEGVYRITAFSALGTLLLLLQTLVFLALSGGLTLVAAGAAVYANQQRKAAAA